MRRNGKLLTVHRVRFEEKYGLIPPGLDLDHLCRVRACVNPDHLEPVTNAENNRRGIKAKLTPDLVREIRESGESARSISRRLGISHTTVAAARRGKSWGSL